MQTFASLACLLALLIVTGCNNSATSPSSGPQASKETDGYLAGAQKRATKTIDVAAVNKAIELYYVQEGRFPKDLLELAEKSYLPQVPELPAGQEWDYDTNSGFVKIIKK